MYEEGSIKKNFIDKIISNLNINFKKNLSDFKKLSEEKKSIKAKFQMRNGFRL